MLLEGQEVAENCAGIARDDVTTWSRESMLRRQHQVGRWYARARRGARA